MKGSASRTKLTPPQVSGALSRRRLFRLIDRLRDRPGIWVAGPAGSGKTTLLSSYVAKRTTEAVLWYQVDEGDADPATFFYYLGTAVRRATPRRRRPMPVLTPEHVPALGTFTLDFFRRLFKRIEGPGVLVLDNFQSLPEASPVHDALRIAMEEMPSRFTLVFVSRELPPPAMRNVQGQGRLGFVGWDDLRLEDEEASGIARLHGFPPEIGRQCVRTAAGWAAGLVLLLEWMRTEGGRPMAETAPSLEYIFDYFAGQIFDKLPDAQQRFLLESAFLPVMSKPALESLTGRGAAARYLRILIRKNYFVTRHTASQTAYQYHPLFRTFLLERAHRVLSETTCRDLESRAAAVLEAEGDYAAAAEYLVRLGDWGGLERLLATAAMPLLRQGRHRTVYGWVAAVPEAEAERRPWLRYWYGETLVFVDPHQALPVLERVWHQFEACDDAQGCYFTFAAVVERLMLLREFGDINTWLDRLRCLRQRHPRFDSSTTEARTVAAAYQALVTTAPNAPDTAAWEARAFELLQEKVPANLRLMSASYLLLQYTCGNASREIATRMVEIGRRLLWSADVSPMALIVWHTMEAKYHCWYGGAEAEHTVRECVEQGLALAGEHDLHAMDTLLLSARVFLNLAEDEHRAASVDLELMSRSVVAASHYDEAHVHLMRAWQAWTAGHLTAARGQVDSSTRLARETGVPSVLAYAAFARGAIEEACGEHRAAQRDFACARSHARRYGVGNVLFLSRLATGHHALRRGYRTRGRVLLRGAFAIGAAERFMRLPFLRKRDLATICTEALASGIATEYAQELVRERDLRPDSPPIAVAHWPWRIEIRCLGDWSLMHEGEPLRFGRKAPRRTLDLLKAMLALGGHEVPETKLLDALWEDEDADRARSALSTALHRLRRLLGHDVILQREGRLGLDPAAVWVDAWVFEHEIDAVDSAWHAGRADETAERLRWALALYRGHFLDGVTDASWAVPPRERLRGRFTRGTARLGEYLETAGAWQEAVDLYQRALDLDELVEAHYQGLLRCYGHLGLRAEAAGVWHRCRRALGASLGVAPSPVTEQLYRTATGARPLD